MDFVQFSDPPIVEKVGNQDVSFAVIPVMVLSEKVGTMAKAWKRDRAKKLVEDNKLEGQEKLIVLRDGDDFFLSDVQDFVNTLEGAVLACQVSLEVSKQDNIDAVLSAMKPWQINKIALLVCQFASLREMSEGDDDAKDGDKKKPRQKK